MAAQVELPEERLKSFHCQLQAESGILDRIVYKNKNQHRRCSYFQYLLKVRRDLKLFNSIHMEELLDSCFNVISGKKPKQKANVLESLKRRKCDGVKFNFIERLQGAARLLSEMVEPILKAATEISTLLARSFFMGFSVMILALLARLRVLVQQILLDVDSVFNEVSSLAQKKQSIKITQDGIEVFREYYPTMEEEVVVLECVWKTDKFVLVETSGKGKISHQGGSSETVQTLGTSIKYQSIGAFLEDLSDDEYDSEKADVNNDGEESLSKRRRLQSQPPISNENIYHAEQVQMLSAPEHGSENVLQPTESTLARVSSLSSSVTSSTSSLSNPNSTSKKSVAFLSIKKTASSTSNAAAVSQINDSIGKGHDDEDNTLFSLLGQDETRCSIF